MKRKEKTYIKIFDMEKASVTGFCTFCRNNIPLIIAVSITLFFTYGIRLFWYSIGNDTELFMIDKSSALNWSIAIGRFGFAALSKLWYIREFNPFTAFFTAFCLIWFFTISWCYIIAIFSRDTGRNNKLIPFALLFMTMPVWAEQFYFLLQAAENALILSLCPYVIYLLFKGFLDHEKGKIICASILLVFMTSVYQAIVPMFCCGVFACFLLLQEYSDYQPQVYRKLCLGLFIALAGSLAVYFFIDRIIIPGIFRVKKADYLDSMIQWGRLDVKVIFLNLLLFCYITTIGHIPLVQNIVHPLMARHAAIGTQTAELLAHMARISGNVLLLPATVFFLIKITAIMRKTIPQGRRLLYFLAGIGVPLSIIFLFLLGGDWPSIRSWYALPLAAAFILFFVIRTLKKKAAMVVACLTLLVAAYQAQITAQLFYSDQMRYNEDVRLAYEFNNLILQVQPAGRMLPVVLFGRYQTASRFHTNFLGGDTIGLSAFGIHNLMGSIHGVTVTTHGLAFMRSLGLNYDMPDEDQFEQAFREAASMPSYPAPGCVRRMGDFIVVKISDFE
jgi:hypothetical protein